MADDLGIAEARLASVREPSKRARQARNRVDYRALLDLVDDDARSRDVDGPAFATDVIRKAIVTGALEPGDAIRQDLMASALSLSKPPVREALRKLEAEQLVVFLQNRGFVVAAESIAELREAWELRIILEPAVLRIAAPHLTEEDFEKAHRLLDRLAVDREYLKHYDLNLDFHLTLYRPSERPHFLEVIERAHVRCQRYSYRRLEIINAVKKTPDDGRHKLIVDKLQAGDFDGACDCLVAHLEHAAERIIGIFRKKFELEASSIKTSRRRRSKV